MRRRDLLVAPLLGRAVARRRTLCLDLPALAKTFDVLRPAVYHALPAVCEDPGKMAVLRKAYRGLAL